MICALAPFTEAPSGGEEVGPAPRRPFDGPLRLALLANGKPNSVELLDAMAHHLERHLPVAEVRRWRKPSVSVAPPDGDMHEIAEWAHAALTAVGD